MSCIWTQPLLAVAELGAARRAAKDHNGDVPVGVAGRFSSRRIHLAPSPLTVLGIDSSLFSYPSGIVPVTDTR